MQKEWFASWFDTTYYHILYKNRDEKEAKRFIQNLVQFLQIPTNSKVLDLACGKGRHALMLNELGLDVLGVDLSQNSINRASELKNSSLDFKTHDMRNIIPEYHFDFVFNLFTSFGYFNDQSDNNRVLNSIHEMLNDKGIVVIDFMNAEKVITNLVNEEEKTIENIHFRINRFVDGEHIKKRIQFHDDGESFDFTEKVQILKLRDFRTLLHENNFDILRTFGDFELNEYDVNNSDRLIIVARKK